MDILKDFESIQAAFKRARRLRKGTKGRPYGAGTIMTATEEELNIAEEVADVGGPTKEDQ